MRVGDASIVYGASGCGTEIWGTYDSGVFVVGTEFDRGT